MSRLRILLLGPDCDPEKVSIPFVTYSHAAALAQLHDVTLVAQTPVEDALRRAKAPFRDIEVVRMPWLERIYAWSLRRIFKYNFDTQVLTAFSYPFSLAFEWRAWQRLRRRIERRQRNRRDARLGQQPLGKGAIVGGAKGAEIEQLEIGALRRQRTR